MPVVFNDGRNGSVVCTKNIPVPKTPQKNVLDATAAIPTALTGGHSDAGIISLTSKIQQSLSNICSTQLTDCAANLFERAIADMTSNAVTKLMGTIHTLAYIVRYGLYGKGSRTIEKDETKSLPVPFNIIFLPDKSDSKKLHLRSDNNYRFPDGTKVIYEKISFDLKDRFGNSPMPTWTYVQKMYMFYMQYCRYYAIQLIKKSRYVTLIPKLIRNHHSTLVCVEDNDKVLASWYGEIENSLRTFVPGNQTASVFAKWKEHHVIQPGNDLLTLENFVKGHNKQVWLDQFEQVSDNTKEVHSTSNPGGTQEPSNLQHNIVSPLGSKSNEANKKSPRNNVAKQSKKRCRSKKLPTNPKKRPKVIVCTIKRGYAWESVRADKEIVKEDGPTEVHLWRKRMKELLEQLNSAVHAPVGIVNKYDVALFTRSLKRITDELYDKHYINRKWFCTHLDIAEKIFQMIRNKHRMESAGVDMSSYPLGGIIRSKIDSREGLKSYAIKDGGDRLRNLAVKFLQDFLKPFDEAFIFPIKPGNWRNNNVRLSVASGQAIRIFLSKSSDDCASCRPCYGGYASMATWGREQKNFKFHPFTPRLEALVKELEWVLRGHSNDDVPMFFNCLEIKLYVDIGEGSGGGNWYVNEHTDLNFGNNGKHSRSDTAANHIIAVVSVGSEANITFTPHRKLENGKWWPHARDRVTIPLQDGSVFRLEAPKDEQPMEVRKGVLQKWMHSVKLVTKPKSVRAALVLRNVQQEAYFSDNHEYLKMRDNHKTTQSIEKYWETHKTKFDDFKSDDNDRERQNKVCKLINDWLTNDCNPLSE